MKVSCSPASQAPAHAKAAGAPGTPAALLTQGRRGDVGPCVCRLLAYATPLAAFSPAILPKTRHSPTLPVPW